MSPEEIVLDNMFSKASLIESGIYSKEQLVQERKPDLLHEYMQDREKPLQETTSANAQKLLELEQLGLLQTYKNYEQSFKWRRMAKRTNFNNLWLTMVRLRKNGNNIRHDKYDIIYNKSYHQIL